MTFDRFMKEFFAEELKDFPNTVYKNDCWYSFTPQGLIHQIFVLRSWTGQLSFTYGTRALVAPLWVVPGNSMKKEVLDRPCKNPWRDFNFRGPTIQEPESVKALHKMVAEFIVPDLRIFTTIQSLYDYYLKYANRRRESHYEVYGTDTSIYEHPYHYFYYREAAYVFSYLHKVQEGLDGIQKLREVSVIGARGNLEMWKSMGHRDEQLFQQQIEECMQRDESGRQFLLLPEEEQQRRLREIFEENRVKIRDLLKIDPKFDMDFIFPEK